MQKGQHSQFVVIPSKARITELFEAATGVAFNEDSTWTKWIPLPPLEAYAWLLEYIRPCHQQILKDTIDNTQATPAALFRQLLRPFDLTIKVHKKGWILSALQPPAALTTVADKPGVTIVWT
jgi:hypothetical protein